MKKIIKIFLVLERKFIHMINYFSPRIYMKIYSKYLTKLGVNLTGVDRPNYIDPSVHFDGVDYSLISIGSNTVISREVLLLTHDYSIFRALKAIGKEEKGERVVKPIVIGNNVFIGARVTVLPGSRIGDDVIIGACSVVKGDIPSGVVVAGNPAKIIKKIDEYALNFLEKKESNSYEYK